MPLRTLTEKDLSLVLTWRNAPEVRRNMYSHHKITMSEHRKWFTKLQNDSSSLWHIYENENGQPLGVIYFTSYEPNQRNSFWGYYAGLDVPAGIGIKMEYEALNHAFSEIKLHKLNCEVLASNSSVINMHKKCGFIEEGIFRAYHYDGDHFQDVVRLGILESEWLAKKPVILSRIEKFNVRATKLKNLGG